VYVFSAIEFNINLREARKPILTGAFRELIDFVGIDWIY